MLLREGTEMNYMAWRALAFTRLTCALAVTTNDQALHAGAVASFHMTLWLTKNDDEKAEGMGWDGIGWYGMVWGGMGWAPKAPKGSSREAQQKDGWSKVLYLAFRGLEPSYLGLNNCQPEGSQVGNCWPWINGDTWPSLAWL